MSAASTVLWCWRTDARTRSAGQFGTWIPGGLGEFTEIAKIEAGAKEWARGFFFAAQAEHPGVSVRLAIGTSNDMAGSSLLATPDAFAHGFAWSQMVWRVQNYIVGNGFAINVEAFSANDFELSWSPPAHARAWLNGYASVTPFARTNYNFGNAPCTNSTVQGQNHTCPVPTDFPEHPDWAQPDWAQEDIWYVSSGAVPARVLPQIYLVPQGIYVNGPNAWQWQQQGLYAYYAHGQSMQFAGTTTQWNACIDNDFTPTLEDDCDPGERNEPDEGWIYLYNQLRSSSLTSVASLPYSTDMDWPPPP